MIRLIMVRHGQTTWNAQKRYQGQSDVPLDETGRQQATALARYFASEHINTIYSSDLQRAVQTAQAIARATAVPVIADVRLREIAFGRWEGLTYMEIQERWPEEYQGWQNDPLARVPPGGETLAQIEQRVGAFVGDIRRKHDGQTVLVVAHGGSLRALVCHALELPSHVFWRLGLASGSVSELHLYSDTAILTLFNDRHPVAEIEASPWIGSPDTGGK